MRTTIENEVRNFYNELKLVDPIIRNPFIHRVHVGKWKKKIEVREFFNFCAIIFKTLSLDSK